MRINVWFILLFIVLGHSFLSCSKESKQFNDWHRMNLKGQIQQIDEVKYPTFRDLQLKQNGKKSFIRFTPKGLINKSAIYMGPNDILWMKYSYKGDSVWIDEVRELYSKHEQPQAYWLYKLAPNGIQKSITSILIDSSINFHIDLETNTAGNTTEIVYSQQKHPTHVPCKIQKVYDDNGHIQEEFSYHYNNILEKCHETPTHSTFKVNEHGDIIREKMVTYEGRKRTYAYHYEYDSIGNWIQRIHYTGNDVGEVITRSYTYY
ncbi:MULTISPECIES: hypothetical protein [unclassified Aureispira]|uniref:hypothetical protein n=1 Tax=unclassified Aureispira TaxID=2649989 RepID=UPI000698BBC7|nr:MULTISPECIES: hypothetical protein [unclassified Aureispira]WMX13804.1 hypothetical protein QP953_23415 [Aureispira sp. CCB-E]